MTLRKIPLLPTPEPTRKSRRRLPALSDHHKVVDMTSSDGAGFTGSSEPVGLRHQSVQRLRKLLRRRRERQTQGRFGIEGPSLVLEALESQVAVDTVFLGVDELDSAVASAAISAGVPVVVVNDSALEAIGSTVTPQPVYAAAALPETDGARIFPPLFDSLAAKDSVLFAVVLVDVGDPGNAGTLLRASEAAGADVVIAAGDGADLFGPKCVRSSAGSIFRLPVVVERDVHALLAELGERGVKRFGATLGATTDFGSANYAGPAAILVGNEAHGLNVSGIGGDLSGLIDQQVRIPMAGRTESLNVAMAGTLLAYEVFRQRNV